MTDFDIANLFDSMPADAYLTIAKWLMNCDRSDLLDLNMGEYYDLDDSFYDNLAALTSVLAPAFADSYSPWYPRLRILATLSGKKIERGVKADFVNSVRNIMAGKYVENQLIHLNKVMTASYEMKVVGVTQKDILDSLLPQQPTTSIAPFEASDQSGAAKESLKEYRDVSLTILNLALPILGNYALERNMTLEFRSPLAFQGPKLRELMYSRFPLSDPTRYMGYGQIVAAETAKQIGMEFTLSRDAFIKWHGIAATLVMYSPHSTMAVVPLDIPSALLTETGRTIPVIHTAEPSIFFGDGIAEFASLPNDLIRSMKFDMSMHTNFYNVIKVPGHESGNPIRQLMGLAAFAFTVLVANVPVGKGNHKPRWTHAKLNPTNLKLMRDLAPYIITAARESL